MSKLIFYGAMSVDGYIARKNHALDWLDETEGGEDTGYEKFYDSIDIVIMGRSTYDQILILSPDHFPYQNKPCYVFSQTLNGSNEFVHFVDQDIISFTKLLKKQKDKRIWIVGGGKVLSPLIQENLVDEFIIQIAPSIIGEGIPLFLPGKQENKLKLLDVRKYQQFVELHYSVNYTKPKEVGASCSIELLL